MLNKVDKEKLLYHFLNQISGDFENYRNLCSHHKWNMVPCDFEKDRTELKKELYQFFTICFISVNDFLIAMAILYFYHF